MQKLRILFTIALFILICFSAAIVSSSSYSVTVKTDRDEYIAGEFVEISGFITDQNSKPISTSIAISVLAPDNISLSLGVTRSNADGYFFTLFDLPNNASFGTYTIVATPISGTPAKTSFNVVLVKISCFLEPNFTYARMPVLVYGSIHPARAAQVNLELSRNNVDWQILAHTETDTSGNFRFNWTSPEKQGDYYIRSSFGNLTSHVATLKVIAKELSAIHIFLSSSTTYVGKTVTIDGILYSTCKNATITLHYKDPEGFVTNHTVKTDYDGRFRDYLLPEKEGTWSISASWPGDAFNFPADCMGIWLVVEPEPPVKFFLTIIAFEDLAILAILVRYLRKKRRANRQ